MNPPGRRPIVGEQHDAAPLRLDVGIVPKRCSVKRVAILFAITSLIMLIGILTWNASACQSKAACVELFDEVTP